MEWIRVLIVGFTDLRDSLVAEETKSWAEDCREVRSRFSIRGQRAMYFLSYLNLFMKRKGREGIEKVPFPLNFEFSWALKSVDRVGPDNEAGRSPHDNSLGFTF